jgi:hypothetical protein
MREMRRFEGSSGVSGLRKRWSAKPRTCVTWSSRIRWLASRGERRWLDRTRVPNCRKGPTARRAPSRCDLQMESLFGSLPSSCARVMSIPRPSSLSLALPLSKNVPFAVQAQRAAAVGHTGRPGLARVLGRSLFFRAFFFTTPPLSQIPS